MQLLEIQSRTKGGKILERDKIQDLALEREEGGEVTVGKMIGGVEDTTGEIPDQPLQRKVETRKEDPQRKMEGDLES